MPGFFRPTKEWDLLVVREQTLIAAIEAKSQVGPSFGNNFNNRRGDSQREASKIRKEDFDRWFQQIWNITGASTKHHPSPYPLELATRLVRMFSFVGDTVLDPFCGSGTTMVAALRSDRNSIGVEIDPEYCRMAARYLKAESNDLFSNAKLIFEKATVKGASAVKEDQALYGVRPAKKKLE